MNITMFYHSLASDWNHGNAHFLRGVVTELIQRGHEVKVYEPQNGWSLGNLIADHGAAKADEYKHYYPLLDTHFYDEQNRDYQSILENSDLVIVHEWNEPELVAEIGRQKEKYGYRLLFHDTHHRAVSEPESMARYDFSNYDGALVFGEILRKIYKQNSWLSRTWTWHEAADTTVFKPLPVVEKEGDLVWIGNWGDDERTKELMEFLVVPVKELGLKAKVYGVRYPQHALDALKDAGIEYGGYLPNYKAPEVFAKYKVTVHVPRGPYVKWLPGIPTIRPFEAMACGIPLICSPWDDAEGLFNQFDEDYLTATSGEEMKQQLQKVLFDDDFAQKTAHNALETIESWHTCASRVDQLESILLELGIDESLVYPEPSKIVR